MKKRFELLSWLGQRFGKSPGWERIVRKLAPPKSWVGVPDLGLIRDGTLFLAQPTVPLGWHVVLFGTYEPEVRDIFRTVLRTDAVAIDVGANVGWHTLLMARLVGDAGRVLAVEANPSVRNRLQENLSLNGFRHVEVVPCALAEAERTLKFHAPAVDDPDAGNGHVVADNTGPHADTMNIRARPLDSVVFEAKLARVDLIKIDVEGFEWPVLQGAEKTVARFRPHIVFEFDEAYAPRGGGGGAAIAEFFRRHHYRLFAVRRNWVEPVQDGAWPSCANIWAVPVAAAEQNEARMNSTL
jgi:FkbM family methyltransferase